MNGISKFYDWNKEKADIAKDIKQEETENNKKEGKMPEGFPPMRKSLRQKQDYIL